MDTSAETEKSDLSFSAWELIPDHIWENILSYLPISSILRMKAVCKTWKSIIQSGPFISAYKKVPHEDNLYFVLFADFTHQDIAAAYYPAEDKWVLIPLSHIWSLCPGTCCKLRHTLVSDGGLVLAEDRKGSMVVFNLFTKTYRTLPSMLPSIWPYVVAIIEEESSYQIIAVSTVDRVYSQVYDSKTGLWEAKGEFEGRFAMLGNAVYLDGFLFCLSHGPDNLLAFDLKHGTWSLVEATMPSVACSHILVHCGKLVLVGGIEEVGVMKRIGIWEFDRDGKQWCGICFMPDHLFDKLSHGILHHFETIDRRGKIWFRKTGSLLVLMYDMSEKRWWWLPPCPLGSCSSNKQNWSCVGGGKFSLTVLPSGVFDGFEWLLTAVWPHVAAERVGFWDELVLARGSFAGGGGSCGEEESSE
ncbi:F-box/kelch-repeat protein At5g15710-like [Magnolia sinica]|uniref:F-box/kelch-repeat protein At5g15710-like n=1 Tax=Magnolia sinica TaxID=86752 RepID=UPI00265A6B1D|nr:F-box/kelch-repeat protein At5g15710-like [Magnolia sinica]